MSENTINLTPSLYAYLQQNSLREPDALKQLRQETSKLSQARMQISPEQGQFMRLLIELLGAKKTLDIGTFTGYSSLSVALALPDDGKVICCDTSTEYTNIARRFWQLANVDHKVDLRLAPALKTLDGLIANGEENTFDFAFIDADKHNYLAYYERSLTLLRKGGLIAIDNVLWSGSVADESIQEGNTVDIRKLNSFVYTDSRVNISMLPLGDGLTLALKK